MKLNPYLTFKGNCEEAINYYKDILDGDITMLMRFKEAPPHVFTAPEFAKELIMHCTLEFGGCTLLASDTIEEDKLIMGSNTSMSLYIDSIDEASAVYNSLIEGGHIIMPFADAFWGGQFGMLVDKFGVQWMVTTNHNQN